MAEERTPIGVQTYDSLLGLRDKDVYTVYDSYVIGEGANRVDTGWADTWQDAASADKLVLFAGRKPSVGEALTNQTGERRDWAQNIAFGQIEFFVTTPLLGEYLTNPEDAQAMSAMFAQVLPNMMTLRIGLADQADTILTIPVSHMPAGHGNFGAHYNQANAPSSVLGTNGLAIRKNFFAFPKNLKLAAKSKIDVELRMSNPVKQFLANPNLASPGRFEVINGEGLTTSMPLWYVIRLSFHGARFLQLRGARSSS